tara:strand:+ start:728 stop:1780 length:1053 start_codon:yes stop_codon:yes gene_type:complete
VIGSLTALLAFASNAHAAQAFKQSPPETYLVQNGDTLWDIAEKFLESPWLWPEVWHINSQIENPHYIYQGDTIKLVYIDGKPRLTVDRGTGSDSHKQYLPDGTLKLTPRKRVSHLTTEIPSVPLDAIQSFLVNHRVVDKSTLDNAPYVVAGNDNRLVMGTSDYFYARDSLNNWSDATLAYGIYRGGEPYFDPETGENLGYEAIQIGLGKFLEQTDDIARVKLVESDEEVRISDLLIPTLEQRVQSVFHPKSPKQEIDGKIIHVFAGVRNVSQYDVVVINKGEREEMEVGDVLATYRVGERVRDRKTNELLQLPSERSGLMIIFRTFEKVSFGLIMKSYKSITVMDEVKNP